MIKDSCASARKEMNKEYNVINEPLLSVGKEHVCFYSGQHGIESCFFLSCPKLPCTKITEK